MKSLVKITLLVSLLALLQSCTVVLPSGNGYAGGGGCGHNVDPRRSSSCSGGQVVRSGTRQGSPLANAYNNGQPAMHKSGYPLMFQPGSRLPSHIDADPNSRYYAGNYIQDSGRYNPEVNAINYTGGDGSTVPVWRGQQSSGQRQSSSGQRRQRRN